MISIKFIKPIVQSVIAQKAATLMNAGRVLSSAPFQNETVTNLWTIDDGNDWAVLFSEGDTKVCVRHRYNDNSAVEGFTRWLHFKLNCAGLRCELETWDSPPTAENCKWR